ncbi:MAG TPA: ImmA/IrrE family metallo-endopeptidase [Acidimicrobiales bacterium]|nr:ImmA/IrrE family metallo-endopeptidase [Acidimicrobiales bacterium]
MTITKDRPDLLSELEAGISRLASSDIWRDHLVFQSRFHRYSYSNVLLIAAQNHRATHVAGFTTWRGLNRAVRRGEKAIWVLAPMVAKRTEPAEGDEGRIIRGFKYVPVFDISQTEGDEPPTVCAKLSGEDQTNLFDRLLAVAGSIGFTVEDHEFGDTTNGDCSASGRRIRVESRNSPAQRAKTLAHEIAHALLHNRVDDRALAELEAESTAYVVCRSVGLDPGDYSFGYVATWAGGGAEAIVRIKTSCDRIQKAAAFILRSLDDGAKRPGPLVATGSSRARPLSKQP